MTLYDQISANKRKTLLLILGLTGFITLVVYVFSLAYGYDPLVMVGLSLILTGAYTWFSFYHADRLILSMSGAQRVDKATNADLYRLVENLCLGDGLPMPAIYTIVDSAPNAFATGRDPEHAAICFTTGIVEKLDRAELEGVAAHELSHVKNYDTRLISLTVILVGVIALLSDLFLRLTWWGGGRRRNDESSNSGAIFMILGLVLALLAPIAASIIRLAISRQREYLADASGAYLTRYPEGLARALEKIAGDHEPLEAANNATASLYFSNPLQGGAATWLSSLFDTHPPIAERIRRLRSM